MSSEPTVNPTLRVIRGSTSDRSYELDREVTVLGKLADCDIVLDQNTVSKRHAMIVRRPDGFYLEDLNSRNRTFLDGRVVEQPVRLADGSVIAICDYRLVFTQPTVTVEEEGSSTIVGVLEPPTADPDRVFVVRAEEKLRALMEINRDLAGTLDLKEVLAKVLTTLFRIFPQADRGFVLLEDGNTAELIPSAIKTRYGDAGHPSISRTVFDRVLDAGQAVLSQDAPAEFEDAKSLVDAQVLTLMAVPLRDRQRRPSGILQLDTRDRRGRFTTEDLDLLAAVADQIGLAVDNARLHALEIRQRSLDQEARDARAVQLALLPSRKPQLPGYEFWDSYEPARSVGGDYFDYVPLLPSARWAISVGDVEGKGMPAAILMARICTEVRSLLQSEPDPARLVARLNEQLCEAGTAEKFITFLLVVLDPPAHRLKIIAAGHPTPLVRRGDGRVEKLGEDQGGLPLGVADAQTYQAIDAELGPGEVVVLYTDGVTEAMDGEGNLFGTEALRKALLTAPAGSAATGETILRAVCHHTAGAEQSDDITLLCFGRRS